MRLLVEEFVPGWPRTKGSVEHRGGGRVADTDRSIHWRSMMAYKFRNAYAGQEPAKGAIRVELLALLPVATWEDLIKRGAQGNGDIDKLLRNVFDALAQDLKKPHLAAAVYLDDAQVIDECTSKRKATPTNRAGVHVRAWEVELPHE